MALGLTGCCGAAARAPLPLDEELPQEIEIRG